MALLAALSLLLLMTPVVLAVVRANELFYLRIREGHVRIRRGRVPQRLFDDISDIVKRVNDATLRGVVEGGRPRLYAEGKLGAEHKQQLRNVIGAWSVAQLRQAPKKRHGA